MPPCSARSPADSPETVVRKREEKETTDTEETRVKHKLTISKALTPLQVKLKNLADLISNVGYAAAVLIFLALLVRGFFYGELNPATVKEGYQSAGWVWCKTCSTISSTWSSSSWWPCPKACP
jgi:hypothetical protein